MMPCCGYKKHCHYMRFISFAAGVSLVGKNVTFCSARYYFKMCDFISGVINVTRDTAVLPQCCE